MCLEYREKNGWWKFFAEPLFTPSELPLKKCAVFLALKEFEVHTEILYEQRWYRVRQTSFGFLSFFYGKGE